jgi:hypothetical protein
MSQPATHLLTTDTVRAEALGGYIARDWSATAGLKAGYSVAFGPVTRVLFLQELGQGGASPAPPAPIDASLLETRHVTWLRERAPHRAVDADVTVLELRSYQARIGLGAEFLDLMLSNLPVRERHSSNFGVWEPISGPSERVFHLWGYRDLAHRNAVRARLKDDADWARYIGTILPMLSTLESTILHPLPRC